MKILSIFLLCLWSAGCFAQNSDQVSTTIAVPLSQPGERGVLKVELVQGSITVKAYKGKEVVVKALREKKEVVSEAKGGMTRIANNSFGVEITEEDNEVTLHSESWKNKADFEIMAPANFDLVLKTVNQGDILVEGVNGTMEVTNVNGAITLTEVSGTVVANTINGKVMASLRKVTADMPMAFTSLNGAIDITLPADIKMTAKIKSDRGEIFSDFDMKVRDQEMKMEKSESGNYKKITLEKWIYGDINGGGAEVMIKNMHGNIYIRKRDN